MKLRFRERMFLRLEGEDKGMRLMRSGGDVAFCCTGMYKGIYLFSGIECTLLFMCV